MAINTFDSDKNNNRYDDVIHVGDHEDSESKFLKELANKVDELVSKINTHITEIATNTAKTSMTLGTSGSTALAGDTNIVTIGSSTTISFGDMITTTVKGKSSYSIVMTVTNGGVSKATTLTLT